MKTEIKYKASEELIGIIHDWQGWLKDERRYSPHTLGAYSRDLSEFFDFLSTHYDRLINLSDLKKN